MKNKKLLNVYMLSIAIFAVITYILPLQKIADESVHGVGIKVLYICTSVFIIISLVIIVVLGIVNLFTDNYDGLKFMQALSYLSFLISFAMVLVFASNINYSLSIGFVLPCIELFFLNSFGSMTKIVISYKGFNKYFSDLVRKIKSKTVQEVNDQSSLKTALQIKRLEKQYQVVEQALGQEDEMTQNDDNSNKEQVNDNNNYDYKKANDNNNHSNYDYKEVSDNNRPSNYDHKEKVNDSNSNGDTYSGSYDNHDHKEKTDDNKNNKYQEKLGDSNKNKGAGNSDRYHAKKRSVATNKIPPPTHLNKPYNS